MKKRAKNIMRQLREGSYQRTIAMLAAAAVIAGASFIITTNMARLLQNKEMNEMALWSYAMERMSESNQDDPLLYQVVHNQKIPFILTDQNGRIENSHLIPQNVLENPERRMKTIMRLSRQNQPIVMDVRGGRRYVLFYGNSALLNWLLLFPYLQLAVVLLFSVIIFMAFRTSKQNEQNRVWIGMAKETAHQLGTPISSLMGWVEYLRSQPNIDPSTTDEMSKDLTRLEKVADRFGKIGSETELSAGNLNEVVGGCVHYFKSRIPRRVGLHYNGLAMAPIGVMMNVALFEWVVENLLKNALDALQGVGEISVQISQSDKDDKVYIDVIDSGKGIVKSNWKKIFEPGFTTKTRGWGLGLSLSKRIIEEYHGGRIWVVDSELGKGTTIRIALHRSNTLPQ